jgi:transposase
MATISLDGPELNLIWKCWDAEYYITFQLPSYVLARDIVKITLPLVRVNARTQRLEFIFTSVEKAKPRKGHKHSIGIDLGKIIPYSMAVANQNGSRVASYESSPRLTRLSRKRERLLTETENIKSKIKNRATRGLVSPSQELELERTTSKSTRLTKTISQQTGSEIARRLAKHNSNLIKVENLTWVSGSKNAKIGHSRWSHSQQQEAITHATKRIGYKTKKVSPRNTSQSCHGCKNTITHRKGRTVWCAGCRTTLDRDFNAAMNIAKQLIFPVSKKLNGDTTGNSGVTSSGSKEVLQEHLSLYCQTLTRKTT